jgi:hypothetical protein
MSLEQDKMAPRRTEVPMLVPDVVRQIEQLGRLGWGAKAIARELGIDRKTARRYLRGGDDGLSRGGDSRR